MRSGEREFKDDLRGARAGRSLADLHDAVEPCESIDLSRPLRRCTEQRRSQRSQALRGCGPLQELRYGVLAEDEVCEHDR